MRKRGNKPQSTVFKSPITSLSVIFSYHVLHTYHKYAAASVICKDEPVRSILIRSGLIKMTNMALPLANTTPSHPFGGCFVVFVCFFLFFLVLVSWFVFV